MCQRVEINQIFSSPNERENLISAYIQATLSDPHFLSPFSASSGGGVRVMSGTCVAWKAREISWWKEFHCHVAADRPLWKASQSPTRSLPQMRHKVDYNTH